MGKIKVSEWCTQVSRSFSRGRFVGDGPLLAPMNKNVAAGKVKLMNAGRGRREERKEKEKKTRATRECNQKKEHTHTVDNNNSRERERE
jgi:hypothetical protein